MRTVRRVSALCGIVALLVVCVVVPRAGAAESEGPATLLCSFGWGMDCDSMTGCDVISMESVGLPPFFKVDLKNKIITEVEPLGVKKGQRKTPIKVLERMNGLIFLQGIEVRAWSAVISEATGKVALTASDDDEAFSIFGICTTMHE